MQFGDVADLQDMRRRHDAQQHALTSTLAFLACVSLILIIHRNSSRQHGIDAHHVYSAPDLAIAHLKPDAVFSVGGSYYPSVQPYLT